jgi:hypothetical protein
MAMRLWRISHEEGGYDVACGFVVRAATEERARQIASENARDEGREVWRSPARSKCEEIAQDGDEEIVLRDFNAG